MVYGVFLNYRVKDEPLGAASIYRELAREFGEAQVFRDTDSLHPGDHYPDNIRQALRQSDIVLSLIGPEWLTLRDSDGTRLIDREHDWVRTELADAFECGIPVIPVLLLDTPCPTKVDLPASINRLATIQAARVGSQSFDEDLENLTRELTDRVPHLAIPRLFDTPAGQPTTRLPSGLLRPEYGLVPSGGRAVELDRLHTWAENPAPVSARLLLSATGDGKTRLAMDFVGELRAAGWTAGVVRDRIPPDATAGIAKIGKPLLLVIDDAEQRVEQVRAIGRTLLDKQAVRSMPARLLLVSSDAHWLGPLRDVSGPAEGDLFRRCVEHRLNPLHIDRKPAEFARAGQAFASALNLSPLAGQLPEPCDSQMPSIVDVHATALATLLDQDTTPTPDANPFARLHRLDQAFWASDGHDLDQTKLPIAIAAATIFGADNARSARALLAGLPGFSDVDRDTLSRYVSWLGRTYPGSGTLNPIYPQQLAIRHVVAVLRQHPELVSTVAGLLDDQQVEQALVTLILAAPAQHNASNAIADLLASDPPRVLPTAVHVLKRLTNPPPSLVAAINNAITVKLPAETLTNIAHELEPLGLRYLPTLQRVQKALIDKISPQSEENPDPAIAAVVGDLNRLGQGLSEGLSRLFNQDPPAPSA